MSKKGFIIPLSELYLYQCCKVEDPNEGEGTTIRLALQIMKEQGVCGERCLPYQPKVFIPPCPDALGQAALHRIQRYERVNIKVYELLRALLLCGPLVAGVEVFSNWSTPSDGIIRLPYPVHKNLGGHAITLIGFDQYREIFLFRNSWGKSWGDAGYGWLRYDYVERYMFEAWAIS